MLRQIHQILPYFAYGDAIGNLVLEIRELVRSWGYSSEIFAENWDHRLARFCHPYQEYKRYSHPQNILLLHYSTGGEANRFVGELPDRSVIYYHNITPAHYFYRVNGELARQLEEAQHDLKAMAGKVPALTSSSYNAIELKELGFDILKIIPYLLSFESLDAGTKTLIAAGFRRRYFVPGIKTWLHVGRFAPNKCIEDIVKTFYYYSTQINPKSHLLLVGAQTGSEKYVADLRSIIRNLSLTESVTFAGQVPIEALATLYKMADVYVSMSEHEGFCIPLIESMYYGLPVVAFDSTAIPFTMGKAGVLVRKKDYAVVAEMIHEITINHALRTRLIEVQYSRAKEFAPDKARLQFRGWLDEFAKDSNIKETDS